MYHFHFTKLGRRVTIINWPPPNRHSQGNFRFTSLYCQYIVLCICLFMSLNISGHTVIFFKAAYGRHGITQRLHTDTKRTPWKVISQVMGIRRRVFLILWLRNVAVISEKYVAVISEKYVAVISEKYVAGISDKYVAVISEGRIPQIDHFKAKI